MSEKPLVRIGDDVWYYVGQAAEKPMMAKVVDSYPNGMTVLAVWECKQWIQKDRVFQRDAQALKDNPRLMGMCGFWDFRDPPEIRNALNDLVYSGAEKSEPPKKTANAKA